MKKISQCWNCVQGRIQETFRHATLNFIFIILFVNVFQKLFGAENSIVGVIFTIMMSASMVRDLTARPVKHLCIQAFILMLMASAACFVSNAAPLLAFPVNLCMIFIILYAYTYEYTSHLYFPYILSYLFLVFISPVPLQALPKRLLGMTVGAVCIILYQLFNGRKRIIETAHNVLVAMIDEANDCIACLLKGETIPKDAQHLRHNLCKLSKIVYQRRRKTLCISDASFAMIDSGRGIENLVLLLYSIEPLAVPEYQTALRHISDQLIRCRAFMCKETQTLCMPCLAQSNIPQIQQLYDCLNYIKEHMLKMTKPEKQSHYHKTLLSFSVRLKAALNISPVRVVYALRVSCLLALCTLLVQQFHAPHGKWLLFTVASVSLPYADDVGMKAKKRLFATVLGGVFSVILYALVPSPIGRTIIMMLSGYLSFYFMDYSATFACSTIGALGGAVFMNAFGWTAVSGMLGIRLAYVLAGILIALIANCLLFPFRQNKATHQLWEKYASTTKLLTTVCQKDPVDPQLYYNLVIQAHLQEDKLYENAKDLNWDGANHVLQQCREAVRLAHRKKRPA